MVHQQGQRDPRWDWGLGGIMPELELADWVVGFGLLLLIILAIVFAVAAVMLLGHLVGTIKSNLEHKIDERISKSTQCGYDSGEDWSDM